MESDQSEKIKLSPYAPHIDWRAYWISAVGGGVIALLTGLILSAVILSEPDFILRVTGSLVLGPGVIPITEGNPILITITGVLVTFLLAFAFALLVVLVIHRWGLIIGLIGGMLVGAAIYVISVYGLSYFFPWIYPVRSWMLLLTHVLFGGLVGVLYELFDNYDLPFPNTELEEV